MHYHDKDQDDGKDSDDHKVHPDDGKVDLDDGKDSDDDKDSRLLKTQIILRPS